MKALAYSLIAAILSGGASVGFGQPGGINPVCTLEQHCQQLDEDYMWAPGTCMYLMESGQLVLEHIEHDVKTYDIEDAIERQSGPYDVKIVKTFFCRVVFSCDDVPDDKIIPYTWTKTTQTCWRISGGVEFDIGTSLVTKLIAELEVSVSVELGWENCETETDSLTVPYDWLPCEDLKLWKEKGTADVQGSVRVASSVAHWYSSANGNEYSSECGSVTEAEGSADTIRYIILGNEQLPCCIPPEGEICCGCVA